MRRTWKWGLLAAALILTVISLKCISTPKPPVEPVGEQVPVLSEPVDEGMEAPQPAEHSDDPAMVDEASWRYLQGLGWEERVGDGLAVWISVEEQIFRVLRGRDVVWEEPCATAAKGTGSVKGSNQTPLGWHMIKRKTGDGAPWGQVFRGGQATKEVWKPGQSTKEDLVLTRVLFLDGLEPGKNKGGNVDSYERYIYIHGTNDEAKIGTPSSHGCIRLRNDAVIDVYELLPTGTPVLITERL